MPTNNKKNGAMSKPAPQKQKQQQKRNPRRRRRGGDGGLQFAPAAQSKIMRPGNPTYSAFNSSDASIVIRHRELFADVSGSTGAYTIAGPVATNDIPFPIQPGRPKVFPWLSELALRYESYDFERLQFDYVPRCSTGTAGFIAMAVDYDAKDAQPNNKVSIMSYHGAVSSAPWQAASLICDYRDLHKMGRQLYCRAFTSSTSLDKKTYDVGNLWVAVGGQASASLIGELYVTYTIRLSTPQLNTAQIAKSKSRVILPTSGVSKAAPLGTAQTIAGGLPIEISNSNPTTKIWFGQAGQYLADLWAQGSGLATGDVFLSPDDAANVSTTINDIADASATIESWSQLLNVAAPGYFTVNTAGATTLTGLSMRFANYAPSSTQTNGSALNEVEVAGED